MKIYSDSAAVLKGLDRNQETELGHLISMRVNEISEYVIRDLSELLRILVIEPGDTFSELDVALGFRLLERGCDLIEVHDHWFELTFIVSDDGLGVVIYVPKHQDAPAELLTYCTRRLVSPLAVDEN